MDNDCRRRRKRAQKARGEEAVNTFHQGESHCCEDVVSWEEEARW